MRQNVSDAIFGSYAAPGFATAFGAPGAAVQGIAGLAGMFGGPVGALGVQGLNAAIAALEGKNVAQNIANMMVGTPVTASCGTARMCCCPYGLPLFCIGLIKR